MAKDNNIVKALFATETNSELLNQIDALTDLIKTTVEESKQIEILTADHCSEAAFYMGKYKDFFKKLEQVRKTVTNPLNSQIKEINNYFKDIYAIWTEEENRLQYDVNDYLKRKRALEEERRKAEQKEMEDHILEEAEMFNDPSVLDVIPEIEIETTKISQETSGLKSVRKKTWTLIDLDKVPRQFLILDEKAINLARGNYDFEVREQPIDGIVFSFEESMQIKR